jgi:hypothetical protein
MVKSNKRQAEVMRGLTYKSKFTRDLLTNKKLVDHVSRMAGKPVCLNNNFTMGAPQVNFGKASKDKSKAVDSWHFDSVDYVLVIILSDMKGMIGGELEVLKQDLGSPEATKSLE